MTGHHRKLIGVLEGSFDQHHAVIVQRGGGRGRKKGKKVTTKDFVHSKVDVSSNKRDNAYCSGNGYPISPYKAILQYSPPCLLRDAGIYS